MRQIAALCFGMVLALGAQAQWYEPDSGRPAPGSSARKHSGQTGAMLVLTSDPQVFLEEWHGTPHGHVPRLTSLASINRNGSIYALVFFAGCAPGGRVCDAVIDFTVLKPDGSVYARHGGIPAWPRTSPDPRSVLLSQAYLRIHIEPEDPLGQYTVQTRFRTHESDVVLDLSETFTVAR